MNLKKIIIIVTILVLLFIVLPLVLISNGAMEFYQKYLDENPNKSFSRWAQLAIGDVYRWTMRYDEAAGAYGKFLEKYPDDPRKKDGLFYYATSLDEALRNREALEQYEKFLEEYPDDSRVDEVNKYIYNLKVKRNTR